MTDAGLAAIVVCSTLITYSGALVASFWHDGAFYLALLLPGFYLLLLGGRGLNRPDSSREARLLAEIGGMTGLLAVVLIQLGSGFAGPNVPSEERSGRLLFAPPLGAVLVAAACTTLRRSHAASTE